MSSAPATVLELASAPAPERARGVFETVLVVDGRPVDWDGHRERLRASARALYGAEPRAGWERAARRAGVAHALGALRVVVAPRARGELAVTAASAALERALVLPAVEPDLVAVRVAGGYGPHKLVDRDWLERIERLVPGSARPLLVSRAGALLETTRGNVMLVRGATLTTPPLDGSILPGVTRAVALGLAASVGLAVREAATDLDDLAAADAVLLTGSLRLLERCRVRRGGAEEAVAALAAALAGHAGLRRAAAGASRGPGAPGAARRRCDAGRRHVR